MKLSHSDKANETLELMNTNAIDWRMATIVWTKELATVPTKVECERCGGHGKIWVKTDNFEYVCPLYRTSEAVRAFVGSNAYCSGADMNKWEKEAGVQKACCDRCPRRRNYSHMGTGEVVEMVEREVLVGRIVWDKGTEFTSRFRYSDGHSATNCQLCAKGINLSGRVPVQGTTRDGRAVAMWVGEDCARKILGVKAGLKKDQFIAENMAK